MAFMERNKEVITAWVAILGLAGSTGKYFFDIERERTAISIAVMTEVHRLLPVVRSHRDWWKGLGAEAKKKLPLIPFSTPVFGGQVQQLGKLEIGVVGQVADFYGYLGYINQLQTLRKAYTEAGKAADFEKQYLESLDKILRDYGNQFDSEFKRLKIGTGP
ncbi:MAG TPA: hypothetical protein VFV04_06140 [Burkholderiales bacterium]|nr:hypothetical protein [Burkholderiales bacterium]